MSTFLNCVMFPSTSECKIVFGFVLALFMLKAHPKPKNCEKHDVIAQMAK